MNYFTRVFSFLSSNLGYSFFRLTILITLSVATGCSYQVDSFSDIPDANPGDYECDTGRGTCTLRAAIMESSANISPDTIFIPPGTYNLTLPADSGGGQLTIDYGVKLQGSGADNTIINQTVNNSVIHITDGSVVEINNLSVQGGNAQIGGGIFVSDGDVEMTNVNIRENHAFTGGGGLYVDSDADVTLRKVLIDGNNAVGAFGGGVLNNGRLFIHASTLSNNESNRAGGLRNGSTGILNLRNVTVSGNSATSDLAGTGGISQNGFAFLNNVTVTDNTGSGNELASFTGGGIQTTISATTVVKNSIIAGNHGDGGPDDCMGSLTGDSRNNLIGDTTECNIVSHVSTYILNQSAELGLLLNNSGATETHLPGSNSPAINNAYGFPPPAINACESHDQRGIPRPANSCDMGAVELTSFISYVTGFMLVDADTFNDIHPLLHGDVIDLSILPANLSVRTITSSTPQSVVFGFNDNPAFQTENNPPFALAGDTGSVYHAVDFSAGDNTITATPYTSSNGTGVAGGSLEIKVVVVN